MLARPDLSDVQGNILRGYRKAFVRHLILSVQDRRAVGDWLLDSTGRDPVNTHQITSAEPWEKKPKTCVNVGITGVGLRALGLSEEVLATFPAEFVLGMAARSTKIGDVGASDPKNWKPEWRDAKHVHLVITIYADSESLRDEQTLKILAAGNGRAFREIGRADGAAFADDKVHFGYRDNIAQPRFEGVREPDLPDHQPLVEIGGALLGYPTPMENVINELPIPNVLGYNGAFNAFRVLEQQVEAFEKYLTTAASEILAGDHADALLPTGVEKTWEPPLNRHDAMRELVAAKLLGRWRNGTSVEVSPHSPTPLANLKELNNFGYAEDPDGVRCPMASHMRRCNPRDARIVQRSTNHTRRIVRRGMPYGPAFDPRDPTPGERGLLGAFICASLIMQFESIQYDWMNLGLLDPRITGTNDPIVGNNDRDFSSFSLPIADATVHLRGFPRFVVTRGGAYLFLPSLNALRYLGNQAK
jgi:deferrochelatase/peroxidase EfeB